MKTIQHLTTVQQVLDALDGNSGVRELTDAGSWQAVDNWRARARFPSRLYIVMNEELRSRGFTADAKLWGMLEHKATESAAPSEARR